MYERGEQRPVSWSTGQGRLGNNHQPSSIAAMRLRGIAMSSTWPRAPGELPHNRPPRTSVASTNSSTASTISATYNIAWVFSAILIDCSLTKPTDRDGDRDHEEQRVHVTVLHEAA
ncbi:hypothetical protein [Kibdelosporangium aridum]|uniref:hypothetical protein n=1 Tax=Kibdelosporangium aridum TaxID=2030 RepID=UPI000526A6BF